MKFQYLILSKQEIFTCSSIHYLSNLSWVTAVERPFPVTASSSAWQVIFISLLAKWSVIQKFWILFGASSSLTFFPNILKYKNVSAKHILTGSLSGSHQQLTSWLAFIPPKDSQVPQLSKYIYIYLMCIIWKARTWVNQCWNSMDRTNLQQVFPKETDRHHNNLRVSLSHCSHHICAVAQSFRYYIVLRCIWKCCI